MDSMFQQFVTDRLDLDPSKAVPFATLLRELRTATGLQASRDEVVVAVASRSDLRLQFVADKLVVSGAAIRAA